MSGDWQQRASEGITVFRASRLEALLEPLDFLLRTQAPGSPLAPQTVVAAHPGMRQWLAGALARHRGAGGIVANLEIVLPSRFLEDLGHALSPANGAEANPWRREVLRWHLHALLEAPGDPTLRAALAGPDAALRRFQLADRLARIYTQYMAYRPDWLAAWARGVARVPDAGFHPALWRALCERIGPARPHRGERLAALARALREGARVPDADQPLHVFGLSHLAPAELDVLQALASQRPVVLHLPDPCREYWAGLRSPREQLLALARDPFTAEAEAAFLDQDHPLLAAWGRLGQHFMLQVQGLEAARDVRHVRDELDSDALPGDAGLLARLQHGLRTLSPRATAEDPRPWLQRRADASLRVHACHTRLRELEVLRDALLRARADDPSLEPSDIVVMAPDIRAYVPLLPAVFGAPGDPHAPLPYHLADVPLAQAAPLFVAFRRLLATPHARLTAPELIDLLGQPDIARRLGLDQDALDALARQLGAARAAWGLDAGFRAAFDVPARAEHTLAWAMDRLITGLVFGDEGEPAVRRLPDGESLVPVPGLGAASAPALAALDHLLQQLAVLRAQAAAPQPASEWSRRLEEHLDALFLPDPGDAAGREAMDALRALVRRLGSEAREAGGDPPLAYAVVRHWLHEQLDAVPARQRFLAGGITVCGMVPQRAIPFEVVAVLGLNEGEYPRGDVDAGLDPIRRPGNRRLGDRDTRSDDRYLFLETAMSARRRLHLSYLGADPREDTPRNPAAPLAELVALLPADADVDAGPAWCVRHPLQPFDPRYFDGRDAALFSFDVAQADSAPGQADPPQLLPLGAPPAAGGEREVEWEALRRYFRDPAREVLARGLRARLEALDADGLADDEPLEPRLDPLDRVARRLCLAMLAAPGTPAPAQAPEEMRLGGVLPAGALGERAWADEVASAEKLVQVAATRADAAGLFTPALAPRVEAPALWRQPGRFRLLGTPGTIHGRDDALWVFEAWPHRKNEAALSLGDRIPLFLAWALLRLAPENAARAVRLCALVPPGRHGTPWQDAINAEDAAWRAAGPALRQVLSAGLEQRVQVLLEAWARPAADPAPYFPGVATALVRGAAPEKVDDAWHAEARHAPGYARLLGRGLAPGEDAGTREALAAQARALAEAIGWVGGEEDAA